MCQRSNTTKTVAIIGRGKTRHYAPYDNLKIDIWAMNDVSWMPRVTASFELHKDWDGDRYAPESKKWMQKEHPFPIYMKEADERIPACVLYPDLPLPPLYKGKENISFFTSTTPYAIALAIHLGYERIELFGIELSGETEYQLHRDCVFYWIGIANGRGREVFIHRESELYKASVYP